MDEHLQRLIEKRRAETCPPEVVTAVRERIWKETAPRRAAFRLRLAVGSVALVLVAFVALVFAPRERLATPPVTVAVSGPEIDPQQLIEDAKVSLAGIGHVLIAAGRSSETIISEQILPPLAGGFQTLKDKLEHHEPKP